MNTKVYRKIVAPAVLAFSIMASATPAFAYEVKQGDTLGQIAYDNGMSVQEIVSINPDIKNINLIYVGDTIKLESEGSAVTPQKLNINVSAEEVDLLARLVEAEASGESYAGKVAVASVVLNRVASEAFPDTIQGVVYQGGQFTPVANGAINRKASADSVKAVNEALTSRTDFVSLYFYNSSTASSRWLDSKPTTYVLGSHTFKK